MAYQRRLLFVHDLQTLFAGLLCAASGLLYMPYEKISVRRHRIADLESFEVSADELDRLQYEEPQRGHELSLCLASLSIAVSLFVPLVVGSPPKISATRLAVFVGIIASGVVFSAFFGLRWWKSLKHRDRLFGRIRARQIGTVGEKDGEISAESLPELPSTDASGAGSFTCDAVLKKSDAEMPE